MSKEIYDKKIKDLIHRIGLLNNLTDDQVKNIVESQFRFTYEIIKNMSLENLTDEDIDNLKKTFYYKYLGKLYTTNNIIKRKTIKLNKEDGRTEES